MIKTIQLLKETYSTYKANFKKIIIMALPILLVTYITTYTSGGFSFLAKNGIWNMYTVIFGIIALLSSLLTTLFLIPALNRAVQRNEDINIFDTKEAYRFQKGNMWRWFMTNVWGCLYFAWKSLPFIIGAIILGCLAFFLKDNNYATIVCIGLAILVVAIGILKNITRFILFKTIVFSKDISARDAVRESIALGISHNQQLWNAIASMFLVGLAIGVVSVIIGTITYAIGVPAEISGAYISPIITFFITTPMLLIMTAKTYVKVRDGASLPVAPVIPVEEVHTV